MTSKANNEKLMEDEVVIILMDFLKLKEWTIVGHCLGYKHGRDIEAIKNGITLIVEAKGARANDNAPQKKRQYFDSGQIKTHFGKAIVKMLEEINHNPKNQFAIAHPDDETIRKAIGHLIPLLKALSIRHYWVSANGEVVES